MVGYGIKTQQKTKFWPLNIHPSWCTSGCWFIVEGRQGSTKHEQPQKVQALGQSITLKLCWFGDATTMAFHIAINNAIFIWEENDNLHLGRIDHCQIDMSSHMNCIQFVFYVNYI